MDARFLWTRVWQLDSVESFKILAQGECTTLQDVDDAVQFQGVKAAFDTIGMEEESQKQVPCGGGAERYAVLPARTIDNLPTINSTEAHTQ